MLKKLLSFLTPGEKRRGVIVVAMAIVMAVLETAGIASVMPFLSVLGNPGVVESNAVLATVYETLQFESVDDFLVALGIGAFSLILVSSVFRMVTHYVLNRFIEMRRHSVGKRLLETYLRQPYEFFLNRHSGDMAKSILSEVDQLVQNGFRPGVEIIAYGVVLIGIVSLLVIIDPVLAAIVTAVMGGLYGLIYAVVRGILGRIGARRVRANQLRFTAAGEALGGIKDIKLLGREHVYVSRFSGPSSEFARYRATSETVSQVPVFLVEAVAFGGIILLTLVLLFENGGLSGDGLGGILPLLGMYAFAGLRMKPPAQKIYRGFARLRFGAAAVDEIYQDLRQRGALAELPHRRPEPLSAENRIELKDVHYAYPQSDRDALAGIDLEVPVGSAVGLVGTTGAGKTTLIDVLLGLLRPRSGAIMIDDEPVTNTNLRAYQQALGYVPQDIFLSDSTVAGNIALGVPTDQIDYEKVTECARMAHVHEFIMKEMPNQYSTVVGERGVRLSGGQRQRIGIARALYHDPEILVFDEATSALDTVTEQAVMEAVQDLHRKKTIIIIAHRLSTVRAADQVVILEKGSIANKGTYDELISSDERFRTMVNQ